MKAKLLSGIIAATFLAAAGPSLAAPVDLALTPTTLGMEEVFVNSNTEPDIFVTGGLVTQAVADTLELLYKADVDDKNDLDGTNPKESGSYADFYSTVFSVSATDPANALISWTESGNDFINCLNCYLAIKDGNNNPGYYVYDLSDWDGQGSISMTGFWLDNGAISHVSIWGLEDDGTTPPTGGVPEPGPLSLLGLGLMGLWFARRKTSA